jgi:hypothetical protein
MSKVFVMGTGAGAYQTKRVQLQEAMRESMIAASGLSSEHLEGAQRRLSVQHHNAEPTLQAGVSGSPAYIGGERFNLIESHVNSAGETVMTAYRQNGPQWEKVAIRQERAAPHTQIVTEVRGVR